MTFEHVLSEHNCENVNYNSFEFPAYVKKGWISQFPNYSTTSHWHEEIEFIFIVSGHMFYNINGSIISLQKGDGILSIRASYIMDFPMFIQSVNLFVCYFILCSFALLTISI